MGPFFRNLVTVVSLLGGFGSFALQAGTSDANALRIIDLHLQARGGRDAIEALQSVRRTAIEKEGRNDFRLEWTWSRDYGVREDQHREHLGRPYHRLRARSGTMVWGHDVTPKRSRPGLLKPSEASEFQWTSLLFTDPCRPFLQGPQYGFNFTYEGPKTVQKRPAYLVKMTQKDGPEVEYAFDQKTFLLLRLRFPVSFSGQNVVTDCYPTGATRLGGVLFETGYDYSINGKRFRKIRFEHNTVNEAVDSGFFDKPYVRPRNFGN